MARTRYKFHEEGYPYFITCTICGWQPVFARPEAVQVVLDSWRHLQSKVGLKILGFVILENHLHLIANGPDLSKLIQRFKSFTARKLIDQLQARGAKALLSQLAFLKPDYKTASTYQLWEEGSHPQQILSTEMMWQKLEYTHNNPVRRGYVDDPVHWRYSSARIYAGQPGLIEIETDWI